jgi:hypothetical protein
MYVNVLNPGPTQPPPYQQPDTVAHPVNGNVANYATGGNPLQVTGPQAQYWQPNYGPQLIPQGVVPAHLGAGSPGK